jgi:Zn-dependent alcohol dehydrogenases
LFALLDGSKELKMTRARIISSGKGATLDEVKTHSLNGRNYQDTLFFSTLTGVRAMTEVYPLERAAEAYERMMNGKARFRVVLITGQ